MKLGETSMKRLTLLLLALVALVMLAGCGDDDDATTGDDSAAGDDADTGDSGDSADAAEGEDHVRSQDATGHWSRRESGHRHSPLTRCRARRGTG